jgi:hypothetical protein
MAGNPLIIVEEIAARVKDRAALIDLDPLRIEWPWTMSTTPLSINACANRRCSAGIE